MSARLTHAEVLAHCLAKPGAWEDSPWEGDVVAKVHDKIFAFLGGGGADDGRPGVGLKCGSTRDEADAWLVRYPEDAVVMAYLGRSGWNSLTIGDAIPDEELLEAVDESFDRVVAKLAKKHRPDGWAG